MRVSRLCDPLEARADVSDEVREIDRALRRLARRQATLDVELLAWLRRAEEENVWPKLGYVHALEYLEEVFAFAPRTATERLRVANELGELPQIEKALARGELAFGAVRELTRVATAETEEAWLAAVRGKRLRDVEKMVAGRKKGDGPDAKPDPSRIRQGVWLELDGESMAAWRQMRAMLDDELGERLDDRTAVIELARRCLAGFDEDACPRCGGGDASLAIADDDTRHGDGGGGDASHDVVEGGDELETAGERKARGKTLSAARPMHMQHSMRCPDCRRAWQLGAGAVIGLSASALARIECDAVVVDEESGGRAAWTIPPATRRKVFTRDHGCCQVPGLKLPRFRGHPDTLRRSHDAWTEEDQLQTADVPA